MGVVVAAVVILVVVLIGNPNLNTPPSLAFTIAHSQVHSLHIVMKQCDLTRTRTLLCGYHHTHTHTHTTWPHRKFLSVSFYRGLSILFQTTGLQHNLAANHYPTPAPPRPFVGSFHIVMELCDMASLDRWIGSQALRGKRFANDNLWFLFAQLLEAVRLDWLKCIYLCSVYTTILTHTHTHTHTRARTYTNASHATLSFRVRSSI